MNKISSPQTIIFSALDWGLGHTTRSVALLKQPDFCNAELFIACEPNSASERILKAEFPNAAFLPLKGYGITYAKTSRLFAWKILLQIPKILAAVWREKKQLAAWCRQYSFDLILSDNRYGFYNGKVKSIFITHQLQIAAPFSFLEKIIRRLNYKYINRFAECLVPDFEGKNNLTGKLSHPDKLPKTPVKYTGPLSRLKKIDAEKKYDLLLLLSGPEPQRTVLENNFLQLRNRFKENILLVRGLPNEKNEIESSEKFTIKNYCAANELSDLIAQSEIVIARSGYSTVMDLFYLQKKAIFIPTPGQTEQEYLAKTLMDKGFSYSFQQDEKDYYKKIEIGKGFYYKNI